MSAPDPLPFYWDGTVEEVVKYAAEQLQIGPNHPSRDRLNRNAQTVTELVQRFLNRTWPVDGSAELEVGILDGSIMATVELFRRREVAFGLSGAYNADGIPVRISNDWLAGVAPGLAAYRTGWGLA
jgi:hypothetical protein